MSKQRQQISHNHSLHLYHDRDWAHISSFNIITHVFILHTRFHPAPRGIQFSWQDLCRHNLVGAYSGTSTWSYRCGIVLILGRLRKSPWQSNAHGNSHALWADGICVPLESSKFIIHPRLSNRTHVITVDPHSGWLAPGKYCFTLFFAASESLSRNLGLHVARNHYLLYCISKGPSLRFLWNSLVLHTKTTEYSLFIFGSRNTTSAFAPPVFRSLQHDRQLWKTTTPYWQVTPSRGAC